VQSLLPGRFVPFEVAGKLLVSLGIGLLVGFEREWAHKDLGVRTFALVSLLGMLTTLEFQAFSWIGMSAVIVLVPAEGIVVHIYPSLWLKNWFI
jgi:uncharacterized membrane protein YhiD involved in acid resistance